MITSIRYHPLIERDSNAHEYAPLFVTTDEAAVRRNHSFYLEEVVNGYFRLCATKTLTLPDSGTMTVACPVCSNRLENITAGKHTPTQALYRCRVCNK
ncbi:MAG: hypothetical protein K5696_05990 [Lachnospiraceae bacterium]|nr:hypothetical protein [Lachnospiraceae bacterium]